MEADGWQGVDISIGPVESEEICSSEEICPSGTVTYRSAGDSRGLRHIRRPPFFGTGPASILHLNTTLQPSMVQAPAPRRMVGQATNSGFLCRFSLIWGFRQSGWPFWALRGRAHHIFAALAGVTCGKSWDDDFGGPRTLPHTQFARVCGLPRILPGAFGAST
jgi:hypothetical protein